MRDSIDMAHDEMFCSVYNVVDIIYNYVAAEALRAMLAENEATLKSRQETERERKYFDKAINVGLMEKTDSGYRWLHGNGMLASLGYFLDRVFNPKGTAQIPCKRLEALFGVTRLDTAISQALNAIKPQKWRTEIDVLFDD